MRKIYISLAVLCVMFVSCAPLSGVKQTGDATEVLEEIVSVFSISDGALYSDKENAPYPLTDALLARMFPEEGALSGFRYVESAAVYFSRRFSEREIIVLKVCDLSHQEALLSLLRTRARKKENAVAFANGVYIYLVCTENNEQIKSYLTS